MNYRSPCTIECVHTSDDERREYNVVVSNEIAISCLLRGIVSDPKIFLLIITPFKCAVLLFHAHFFFFGVRKASYTGIAKRLISFRWEGWNNVTNVEFEQRMLTWIPTYTVRIDLRKSLWMRWALAVFTCSYLLFVRLVVRLCTVSTG